MIVTAANSEAFRELAERLLPPGFVCLELSGKTAHECDIERFRLTADIARTSAGVMVACEADVSFDSEIKIPNDRITVEKGDRRLELDYPGRAYGWSPWAGFLSGPAEWMAEICSTTARAMEVVVRDPCLALYWALEACGHPWEVRVDSAFWPRKAAITHYRGKAAKREVCPNLF